MFNTPSHFARRGGGTRVPPSPAKRKDCQLFAEGRCPSGPKCPFLHRIVIKRPIGYRSGGVNDNAGLLQRNHDSTLQDSKADIKQRTVGNFNPLRNHLDAQGQSQPKTPHKPDEGERTPQRDVLSAIYLGQASDAHCDEETNHPRLKTNPCFEWEKTGACARGDACWYKHDAKKVDPVLEPVDETPSPPVEQSSTYQNEAERRRRLLLKEKPCFAWAKGTCERGDACWYKHDMEVKIHRTMMMKSKYAN